MKSHNLDSGDERRDTSGAPLMSRRSFLGGAVAVSVLVGVRLPWGAGDVLRGRGYLGTGAEQGSGSGGRFANVQVSHGGPGRGHGEPSLAVNPQNPRNLLAVSMWGPDTYVSFDGGLTWRPGGRLRLPAGSGGGNVSVAFDGNGHGFISGLFSTPGSSSSVLLWRTEDGGRTFTQPVVVTQGVNLDRPWVAADEHQPGLIHIVVSEGTSAGVGAGLQTGLRYSRSTDAGKTFEAPRTIAVVEKGLGNPIVACGASGSVYIVYSGGRGAAGNAAPDARSSVSFVSSHDNGKTFRSPFTLGRSTDLVSFPGLPSNSANASLPSIAADPRTGLVCVVFTDHTPHARHCDVLIVASRNGGRSWSRVTTVTPRDHSVYFQPQVAIDQTGRIGVMAFAMVEQLTSVVLMISEPDSLRFGRPITISDRPFDPAKVNYHLGDYQTLAATSDAFHPVWNDTRTGQLELFTAAVRA